MSGWIKSRNLHPSLRWDMEQVGLLPSTAAKKYMVYRDTTAAPYAYWHGADGRADQMFSTLATAYDATTSARNDVVLLTTESHQLASSLTWANYDTHLIGMQAGRPAQFQRARFGASDNFTPVTTLSGWGCTWANLRVAHGRGNAGNLCGIALTGHYNNMTAVHLYSPGSTTESAVGSYTMHGMELAGGNNYFEDCTFGIDTIARSAANGVVKIMTSGVDNIFKDCVFLMFTTSADVYFIYVASGSGVQNRWTLFDNCTFINYSTNWATSATVGAIYQYSGGTGHRLLFKDCSFMGVTDVISSDDSYRNNAWFSGGNTYLSATTGTGLYAVST